MTTEAPNNTNKKKKPGGRGRETLFRVSARNQIELIAIADNKANMILGINVILISVLIALFGSGQPIAGKSLLETPELITPFGILMIACLGSAIFAVWAAKPKLIKAKNKSDRSLLFFDNFYRDSLAQYIEEMNDLLDKREKVYEQMIIDMYNNGLVLERKYRLLITSYMLFLIGLTLSVIALAVMLIF